MGGIKGEGVRGRHVIQQKTDSICDSRDDFFGRISNTIGNDSKKANCMLQTSLILFLSLFLHNYVYFLYILYREIDSANARDEIISTTRSFLDH